MNNIKDPIKGIFKGIKGAISKDTIKLIITLPLLASILIYWSLLLIIVIPLIMLEILCHAKPSSQDEGADFLRHLAPSQAGRASNTLKPDLAEELLFDRRTDLSKIDGCHTRNVTYRWSIFEEALKKVDCRGHAIKALDFGAGSLRDSLAMAQRGYAVTSFDMDKASLQRYWQSYNWEGAASPEICTGSLDQLRGRKFDVITAFDVIEHLEEPRQCLLMLRSLLKDDGVMLITVPNGRSLLETYSSLRKKYALSLIEMGKVAFGAAHLQFNSPAGWKEKFTSWGFHIQSHDMAIGFLVNDLFYGMIANPIRLVVAPVLGKIADRFSLSFDPASFENIFLASGLMERVNRVDQWLKPLGRNQFGWCLFVLQKDWLEKEYNNA